MNAPTRRARDPLGVLAASAPSAQQRRDELVDQLVRASTRCSAVYADQPDSPGPRPGIAPNRADRLDGEVLQRALVVAGLERLGQPLAEVGERRARCPARPVASPSAPPPSASPATPSPTSRGK